MKKRDASIVRKCLISLIVLFLIKNVLADVDIKTQVEDHIKKGKDFYHHQKYKEAIAEYKEAVKIEPSNSEALGLMGYSELKMGDIDGAFYSLGLSVNFDPDYVMGYYNLALAYWAADRKENSVLNMQIAVDLDPNIKKEMEKDAQFKSIISYIGIEKWALQQFYIPSNQNWLEDWKSYLNIQLNVDEVLEDIRKKLKLDDGQRDELKKMMEYCRGWQYSYGDVHSDLSWVKAENVESDNYYKKCLGEAGKFREIFKGKEEQLRLYFLKERRG
jgi:tetratricopeptide (TPR) repeat protein